MPAPSRRPRGRGPSGRSQASRGGPSNLHAPSHQQLTHLSITGWQGSKASTESDGGIQAFTNWLERKARQNQDKAPQHGGVHKKSAIRIRKSRVEGNTFNIWIPADEAQYYTRLDGFTFASATINVRSVGAAGGRPTHSGRKTSPTSDKPSFSFKSKPDQTITAALKEVLFRRYNVDNKILDLTAVMEEPECKASLSNPANTPTKLWALFASLCEEAFPDLEARKEGVIGLQIANNNISNLQQAKDLVFVFPELLNLDLSNNRMAGPWHLSHFRKLTKLEHILVAGNPWLSDPKQTHKADLIRAFPNLKFIDGVEITPEEKEAAGKETGDKAPGFSDIEMDVATTASEEQLKMEMVVEIRKQTGLNQEYAVMCLDQTGWNLQAALESFQQVRANIPPEAFQD